METFVLVFVGLYLALVGAIVVIYVVAELLERFVARGYKKNLLKQENVKQEPWDGVG
jgi:hypothetical protein